MKTRISFSIALLLFFTGYFFFFTQKNPGNTTGFSNDSIPGWKKEAQIMVETQLRSRDIRDTRVLNIMSNTPRHLFVPETYSHYSYDDTPLPIGYRQTISQPYIVALMTGLLELQGNEKILEIGTGSGYQAAILAQLAATVYTIEIICELADSAEKILKKLEYYNVKVKCGNGYKGWPEFAPFDGIIVTAAPEEIPEELIKQLKPGGRMVVPVGKLGQDLLLITKTIDGIKKENIAPVRFVPMVHPVK